MRTGQILECKFQVQREVNGEGEKEVAESPLWYMDFEIPQGHSSSGIQSTVGKEGLWLRGGNSLEMET